MVFKNSTLIGGLLVAVIVGVRMGAGGFSPPASNPWTTAQRRTLAVFGFTALAWLTRTEPWGGWSEWLQVTKYAGDSTVALLAAVTNVLLPIIVGVAKAADIDPLLFLFPATFGLNWSFMLPVGTAPNAIIYGTGYVAARAMLREGFVLNFIGSAIISFVCLLMLSR